MVQLEFDFNERKKTAVEWFNQQLVDRQNGKGDSRSLDEIYAQAKAIEEQRIKDAIMYALDEDGHTGDWKIKFANDYINNLKQTK